MNQKALLDVQQLSTALNISVGWIYQQTSQKKIPFIKVGKYVRFDLDEVIEFFRNASLSQQYDRPTMTHLLKEEK